MSTPIPSIPDDAWIQITDHLNVADLNALMSVDTELHHRLRTNPRAWQTHLNSCTHTQLTQIAAIVPSLALPAQQLLKLRAMTTLAGTAHPSFGGDGGPAHQAKLSTPRGVAVGRDGTVYIADAYNHRIRRITSDGVITTLAGTGQNGYSGDNGPAHQAQLYYPHSLAVGSDGTVYVADMSNHCIRRITLDGTITTLAGTGGPGYSGDNGPAHQAQLYYPTSVAVGPDGTVYIADTYNERIRYVAVDGTITTLAGTGEPGYSGDNGPAHQAQLCYPVGLAVGPDGTVYIADTSNHRIRHVALDGTITTLAGTGRNGYGGDNGPGREAQLQYPTGVAVDPDGTLYIADTSNHRIRHVALDGTITTVAGTGQNGYGGDGGPSHQATLTHPRILALGPDRLVHVTTGNCLRRFGIPH
ncbi:NHL repeat-containing protein [Streptomyces sp. NPDC005529]|uniref:NHL repeat-containing protein n=1 Tax=unclassified Streptomyces TaxID=2593676 RepID=UPI0033B396AC